jgi:ComF family protein
MQFIDICSRITHSLLPQDCLLCGNHCGRETVCLGCRHDLPYHASASCPVCAMPSPQAEICGACLKRPPHFDATLPVFEYAFPVDALMQSLKYGGRLIVADLAGEFLAQRVANRLPPDLLIAMPMHHQRLKERGFNQAAEIARTVSRKTGIFLAQDLVVRIKATEPQAGLPLAKRKRNMRNVFACTRNLSGKRVAIVDDVMTSGASLDELAKTLKKSGATWVECWIVARTLRNSATRA